MTSPDLADTGPAIRPATELLTKPPWAAYLWADEHNICLELPCPVGKAPVIVQYPITEGGLAKALSLVVQCANIKRDPPPAGWFRHGEAKPRVSKPATPKLASQPAVLQSAVQRMLRKAGMI